VYADLVAPSRYGILSTDPVSGATRLLHATVNEHTMPLALPTGDVAFSSDGDHGLALLLAGPTPRQRLLSPLGDGSDAATHASPDGRFVAVRHTPLVQAGPPQLERPPVTVAFDLVAGRAVPLDVPAHHFVDAIGFLPGGAP
jgi:hypothetical protein